MFKKILTGMILCVIVSSSIAAEKKKKNVWNEMKIMGTRIIKPNQTSINTLMITRNYHHAVGLADLIQSYTGQPYLLLPAEGETQITFNPSGDNPSFGIHYSNLKRFMQFLRPKQVLFLGDESYVSKEYKQMLKVKKSWSVSSSDWANNAERVGAFFKISSLKNEYIARFNEIDRRKRLERPEDTTSITAPVQSTPTSNSQTLIIQEPVQAPQ